MLNFCLKNLLMSLFVPKNARRFFFCLFLILLLKDSSAQNAKKKVVFVIADGIPADVIERVAKPSMDQIIGSGVYQRA